MRRGSTRMYRPPAVQQGEKPKRAKNVEKPWQKDERKPPIPNLYITSGEVKSPSPFDILKGLLK